MRGDELCGETALIEQLLDLASRLRERLAEPCEAQGVNAARFAVLRAIAGMHDEGCSQTELANRLGLSESNVCSLVERLRESGLLFRFRSKTDRRRSVLMLTEQGRLLVEAISLAIDNEAVAVLSVLNTGQLGQLHQLVQRLREQFMSETVHSSNQNLRRAS